MYPSLSVVIPTYNRSTQLYRALTSLTRQTYSTFEVIVVDDGSTDNTLDVIRHFNSTLDIHYVKTDNWGGPARPRNIAISYSSSELIAFLDSDDAWLPTKVSSCLEHFSPSVDILYHDLFLHYEDKQVSFLRSKVLTSRRLKTNTYKDLLYNGNPIALSSVVLRRAILPSPAFSQDRSLIAAEDYDLWLQLALHNRRFFYLPQKLGIYCSSRSSLSSGTTQLLTNQVLISKYIEPSFVPFLYLPGHISYSLSSALFKQHLYSECLKVSFIALFTTRPSYFYFLHLMLLLKIILLPLYRFAKR